ncbi:MAG: MmcQ/YjbR family DNA-binding protein [Solirubrobacteraceae bacterium]
MLTIDHARELALALPGAVEQDHHGRPSFRVAGRILATLWTDRAMNVMAGAERIRAAAEGRPDVCSEIFWGKRLAAVQVDLERADPELLEDLLDHAWRTKAPARLLRETALATASPPSTDRAPTRR